jgi:hypothetical protein
MDTVFTASPLIDLARRSTVTFPVTYCAYKGLHFQIGARDPEVMVGVVKWLHPLLEIVSAEEADRHPIRIHQIFNDALVSNLTRHLMASAHIQDLKNRPENPLYYCEDLLGKRLVANPLDGWVLYCDHSAREYLYIHSSRTKRPHVRFSRLVYRLIMRHDQQHGAVVFHAGAVSTKRGGLLVLGRSGAGKTSLISGLVAHGASFIANERCLIQKETLPTGNSYFSAIHFAEKIFVGLGTAMQFPKMARLLPCPDHIELHQDRLAMKRMLNSPKEDWPSLPGKISLLTHEFTELVDGPPAVSSAPIIGIIQPDASKTPTEVRLRRLKAKALQELLIACRVGVKIHKRQYPDVMGFNVADPIPDFEGLAKLPAIKMDFHLSNGGIPHEGDLLTHIHDELEQTPES